MKYHNAYSSWNIWFPLIESYDYLHVTDSNFIKEYKNKSAHLCLFQMM